MKNALLTVMLAIMLSGAVVGLLTLLGYTAVQYDLGTPAAAAGTLLMTLWILGVFIVGPWGVGWVATTMIDLTLRKSSSSPYWHWPFLLATSTLLLVAWPLLIQGMGTVGSAGGPSIVCGEVASIVGAASYIHRMPHRAFHK